MAIVMTIGILSPRLISSWSSYKLSHETCTDPPWVAPVGQMYPRKEPLPLFLPQLQVPLGTIWTLDLGLGARLLPPGMCAMEG